ncbi:MAG: hypothetical protein WA240_13610 [Nitrospirota bacterium]
MSKFKVMKWIRKIRDKNYEETKLMSKKELLEFYKRKAEIIQKKVKVPQ